MAEKVRGSELLKHRYTEEDLTTLLEAGEADGITLLDFFPLGMPAPDGGWGVWRVEPERLPDLIAALTRLGKVPNIKIFPKGILEPRFFEVAFEAGSGRRG